MISFLEYVAWREGVDSLGTAAEMLARLGITTTAPHEIDVKRLVKRLKKQAVVQQAKNHGVPAPHTPRIQTPYLTSHSW